MKQLVIDIPLQNMPADLFPAEMVEKAREIRVLRLDLEGFLLAFHIPENETNGLVRRLRERYSSMKIGRLEAGGAGERIIRVSGEWWKPVEGHQDSKIYRSLKALEKSQAYFLKSPEITGRSLRITLAADPKSVRHFQKTFKNLGIDYHVRKLSELDEASDSPLGNLTATQLRILRLAYSRGYYDLPRKTDTEQLAGLLEMEKGTVGRHLRRAEKHLMDQLVT